MKLIRNGQIVLAACLSVAVVGCGGSAAKAPTKSPTAVIKGTRVAPTATPIAVTSAVTTYAQAVQPVVRSGIVQATMLITEMQKISVGELGKECVQAASGLSSNRDAFNSVPYPVAAKDLRAVGRKAYQIVLGSSDECGIAADSNSAKGLSQAAKDMQGGIHQLNTVQRTLAGWAAKH